MNDTQTPAQVKPVKKPNLFSRVIRWKALLAIVITFAVIGLSFHFWFDALLKYGIEKGGYAAVGAEVNVSEVKTSFLNGSVAVYKLEITDSLQPKFNSIEIGQINFDVNMDALLRLKGVIEKMSVEDIQFQSLRKYPGKVAPPEPPKPDEPSFTDQLKQKALGKLGDENQNNLIGNIASFLQSGDSKAELKNIENLVVSKKMAEDMDKKWSQAKNDWDQKIKTLPKQSDLDGYKKRFEQIKHKDFKTPQELQESISQFNALKSDVDGQIKSVNETKNKLVSDVNDLQKDYKTLEAQIKTDIDTVKTHFKIPKIDAAQFSKSLFMGYLIPYTQKLDHYKNMAQKYLPPKYAKMLDKPDPKAAAQEDTIQPHPREKGVSYEFPIKNGYPLYWIQDVMISSKSNKQVDYGDIKGQITNITSNQRQINKTTNLDVSGDFKSKGVFGIALKGIFNNLKAQPEVSFNANVGSYPLQQITLMDSPDVSIGFPSSKNSLQFAASTVGFKTYAIEFENTFKDVAFDLKAKEKIVNELLGKTLAPIKDFNLKASAKGEIKNLDFHLSSNLGTQLEAAFQGMLKQKLAEVETQVRQKVDEEVAKQKDELEKKLNSLSKGYINDVSSSENLLNQVKTMADDRINTAKKDLENKAKAKAQEEGKKAVDGLKKKLGF